MRTAKGMLATPLDAALHKGHRSTAKYLQVHGGVPAARLNSESAALRGPNTRNLTVQNKKPLDCEKEKSDVTEQRASRKVQSSPQDNAQIAGQKQKILQVYVEDGVMIRRIKHSQVGEGEERIKRRRRKRKTKYKVDKSYLRSKDNKHGRRGYDESSDEDGYTSQDSSIGEFRIRTESDSDQILKQNPEIPLITDSSHQKKNSTKNKSMSEVVTAENINATEAINSAEDDDLLLLPIKENELNSEMKYKTEIPDIKSIESTHIDGNLQENMTQSVDTEMETNEIKQFGAEKEDKSSAVIVESLYLQNEELRTTEETMKANISLVTDALVAKDDTVGSLVENVGKVNESEYASDEECEQKINSETINDYDISDNTESLKDKSNVELKNRIETENSDQNPDFQIQESFDIKNENKSAEKKGVMEMWNQNQNDETKKENKNEEGDVNISPKENSLNDSLNEKSLVFINETEIEEITKTEEQNKNVKEEIETGWSIDGDTSEKKEEIDIKDATTSDLNDEKHEPIPENEIKDIDILSIEGHKQEKNKEESKSDLIVRNEEHNNGNFQILNESSEKQQVMKEGNEDIPFLNIEAPEKVDVQPTNDQRNELEQFAENVEFVSVKKDEEEADNDSNVITAENKEILDSNESKENKEDTFITEELETLGSSVVNEDKKNDEVSLNNTDSKKSVGISEKKELGTKVSEEAHEYMSDIEPEKPVDNKSIRKFEKHQTELKNERSEHGKKDRGLIKVLSDEKLPLSMSREEKTKPIRKEWKKQRSNENWETRSISPQLDEDSIQSGKKSPTEPPNFDAESSPRREKHSQGAMSVSKSRIPRMCNRGNGEKNKDIPISTVSVTQAVQYSVRKYHLERRIFHQLLELKRLQIRAGRASEGVLVKRLVDDYRRAGLMLGLQQYNGVYTFRAFEKYLYDQLRLLQSSERRIIPRLKSSDDLEKLTAALRKTRVGQDILTSIPSNPALCTYQTHRCHHATHAYTGVPCAAYIKKNHHTMSKPGSFLPKLVNDEGHSELAKTLRFVDPSRPLTLELSHGSEKQVITLPTEKLDKSKRYFVTFTIKTGNQKKAEGSHAHTHASSV